MISAKVGGRTCFFVSSPWNAGRRNLSVQSSCGSAPGRWSEATVVEPGLSSYSSLAWTTDGRLLDLYDVEPGIGIRIAEVPLNGLVRNHEWAGVDRPAQNGSVTCRNRGNRTLTGSQCYGMDGNVCTAAKAFDPYVGSGCSSLGPVPHQRADEFLLGLPTNVIRFGLWWQMQELH